MTTVLKRQYERRRSNRVSVNGKVRLREAAVGGFLLDASDDGLRAVLWTLDVRVESMVEVVLLVAGQPRVRYALVRWARGYREGSVVGLELLPEDELAGEPTSIRPTHLVPVGDPRSRDVVMQTLVRVG